MEKSKSSIGDKINILRVKLEVIFNGLNEHFEVLRRLPVVNMSG